jgi:hypothetical protein
MKILHITNIILFILDPHDHHMVMML